MHSPSSKEKHLLTKVLLPNAHPRSSQKPALAQTHVSGLARDREGCLLGLCFDAQLPLGAGCV